MRCRTKIYVLIGFFPFFGLNCINNENSTPEKTAKKVPAIFREASDLRLHAIQDTLYDGNHKFSGIKFQLYPNGDTAFIKPYLNGLEEGWQKIWYPDHKLAERRFYITGKKEGIHQGWWPNGLPKFRYEFYHDEFNGTNKEWYETGMLFKKFHYVKGYEDGSQQMFWANGKIRANYIIKNNRRYGLLGTKNCINVADSVAIKL